MIATTKCLTCGEWKQEAEYYRSDRNHCRECIKARVRERRRTNPAVQAYDRERAKTPERRAHARRVTIKWRTENPEAYVAETAVGNALRDGRLEKKPCEVCGRPDVHGHHDDYSKPLAVRWLCPLHHHRHHAEARAE